MSLCGFASCPAARDATCLALIGAVSVSRLE
jgi:hypothetical protein